jgi:hypothetical protein
LTNETLRTESPAQNEAYSLKLPQSVRTSSVWAPTWSWSYYTDRAARRFSCLAERYLESHLHQCGLQWHLGSIANSRFAPPKRTATRTWPLHVRRYGRSIRIRKLPPKPTTALQVPSSGPTTLNTRTLEWLRAMCTSYIINNALYRETNHTSIPNLRRDVNSNPGSPAIGLKATGGGVNVCSFK